MKTLKITFVAAIFCLTLTGLTIQKDIKTEANPKTSNNDEQVSQKGDFNYAFQVNRHVKKGKDIPAHG
ncbi:hypothetical protein BZARG_593 [Bizionia argentinensis JUB59]|uniref:Uncharacterized protein n=1 Tax=Bizionia argentinensis JUB59 TaxID=1046627 RepID=G2EHK5_9FLAO|nr:hypothetical protein [Bizionia argentinensis]EGV42184.2 hypothetical protein BZARG_593 [Bizionia argentinensis JUB59]